MKRKVYIGIIGVIVTGIAFLALHNVFFSPSVKAQSPGNDSAVQVTAVSASQAESLSIDFVGTVKAIDLIKVLPAASGQIISSKINEGDVVHQGDVLFEIGGMSGIKHPLQSQFELAQAAYNNSKKAVDAVKEGNDAALKAAQLGVQSAKHQAQAMALDVDTYSGNIDAAQNGISILQSSLDATRYNNQQNFSKADLAIR